MKIRRSSGSGLNLPVLLSFNELAWMAMFLVVVLLFAEMKRSRTAQGTRLSDRNTTVDVEQLLRTNQSLTDQRDRLRRTVVRQGERLLSLEVLVTQYSNRLARILTRSADEMSVRRELLGLGGPLSNVVFIVDVSESMVQTGYVRMPDGTLTTETFWNQTRLTISNWLVLLPVHRCALVAFSNTPVLVRANVALAPGADALVDVTGEAGAANRSALLQEFAKITPHGNTDTHAALELVARIPRVDTIILFSDGHPNNAAPISRSFQSISNLIVSKRLPPINTIGVGSYDERCETVMFLLGLAKLSGGTFLPR